MKTRITQSKIGRLSYFHKDERVTKTISCIMIMAILNLTISCSYFTVKNVPTTRENISTTVKEFNNSEKYVIIHSKNRSWHLSNTVINEYNQTISGTVVSINSQHQYTKPRESQRVHRYNNLTTNPLNEVHFYLNTSVDYSINNAVSIPLVEIASISVNDKNTGRAIANVALTTVGVFFVVALIVAATKSSCPFVYIKNGENFEFVGELYPGTITPNMQKDDYLQLPHFKSENGEYTLKISNYLKEIQYTDQVQLVLINHEKNLEVLMDSKGQLQTFNNLVSPVNATKDNGSKNLESVIHKDYDYYAFDTALTTENSTRNIVFEFEKPEQAKEAKLYLTAKNSVWLDYIFGKFNEKFGYYYNTFQKEQQQVPNDSIKKWTMNQHIPLSIYKNTKTGWELVERIGTVGPMAMRDLAIPISLDNHEGNMVKIKLETGFMFWEVDYVGMDFSENLDLQPEYINASKALDQNGNDVTALLAKADQNYFAQANIGDEVVISFPTTGPKEGQSQTVILKNRGYYNYIRDYSGIPDFEALKSFKEDNAFTKYAEKSYFEFANFQPNELAYHE
ncbi:hypothetical protein [Confluentibacter flavum]|nr:hypothetical protein [Confluentibacter flavum]